MWFAEHSVLMQCELLARGELAAAGVARKARQVVHLFPSLAHPVRGGDASAALRALCTEASVERSLDQTGAASQRERFQTGS